MTLRSGFSPGRVVPVALVGVLLLLAPIAALANSSCPSPATATCIFNTDGTVSSSGTGAGSTLSLTNSGLLQVGWKSNGLDGKLSFKTGAMLSGGSYGTSATFSDAGSSFTITGNYNGVSGTLFKGQFSSNITWTLINPGTCSATTQCIYDLFGDISGTWFPNSGPGGVSTTGATVQLYFTTIGQYTGKGMPISDNGGTSFVNVPLTTAEPASLALMGTGLLGVGFLARHKVKGLMGDKQ